MAWCKLHKITGSVRLQALMVTCRRQVLGAGKTEGAMDAANMLKPMLARGELRCIGATTIVRSLALRAPP